MVNEPATFNARDRELITRLDERSESMQHQISGIRADIATDMQELKDDFVTKAEFVPVRSIVYGLVGAILLIVIGALMKVVLW